MHHVVRATLVTLTLFWCAPAFAFDYDLRLDGGLVFSHFEQQVKTEVGGEQGEKLVEDTEFGLQIVASWNVWRFLDLGIYTQFDIGNRSAARFDGFDDAGRTVVSGEVGGAYSEFWLGPLVRAGWKGLFVEFAYGAIGLRSDDARDDLATADGDTESALQTSPTIAWVGAIGGMFEVIDDLQVVLKLEYRVRYYTSRGGDALANEIVHGTQNFTPFLGVAWTPTLLD